MDPAAPLSSDMKGLKVCILADGIPLRAMGHTGPPERRIAYVEINEPHAIAIRLTLSRGFRPYKHRITVDYSWDGNEPFETPIIKKSQYSTHAYTDTIDTVTVKENGIETEHRFRIKPLSISDDPISKEEAGRYAHLGEIKLAFFDVEKVVEMAPERPEPSALPADTISDAYKVPDSVEQTPMPLDAAGDTPQIDSLEHKGEIASAPVPEKAMKGVEVMHGIVLEKVEAEEVEAEEVEAEEVEAEEVQAEEMASQPGLSNTTRGSEGSENDILSGNSSDTPGSSAATMSQRTVRRRRRQRYHVWYQDQRPFAVYTFCYRTRRELVKLGIIEQRKARVDYNNINNEELHAELRARDAELEKQSQGHGKVKREQVLADTERLRKVSDQLQGQTIVIDDDDSLLEAKNRVSGSRGAHGRKVQRYSGSMSAPGRLHD